MIILSNSIGKAMTESVSAGLNAMVTLAFYALLVRILIILGVVALITWVVKKVWNAGSVQKPKTHKRKAYNQWTNDWMQNAQARQNNRYEYNDPIQFQKEGKWSPTGWYWDDKKGKWIPPDYMNSKSNTNIREPLTPEERELAKQIHIDRSQPSYEEWKAAQMKKPPDGAYHYDYIHIPNNETITEVKILKPNKSEIKAQERKETNASQTPKPNYSQSSVKQDAPKTSVTEKIEKQSKSFDNSKFKNGYEARDVLTKNEMRNYRTLYEAAVCKGYSVSSKMRLADIVKPRNEPQYMARFRKISQYHVDFVILDMNMRVKAVIELDDNSHDKPERIEHDRFIDEILQDCGIRIIRTRHIWPDILDDV